MRKMLLVVVLVTSLCLSTAVGNSAIGNHGFTDTDVVSLHGSTGNAVLITQSVSFRFPPDIQPGEQLYVQWWIENDGDCPLWVSVALTGIPGYLNAHFLPGYGFGLRRGMRKNVALVIRMPLAKNLLQHQNRTFTIKVTFTSRSVAHRWQTPSL